MANDIPNRIRSFNSKSDPDFLPLKYKAMREDRYRFFRATTHLFYEDIPAGSFLHQGPDVWLCGDLHLENFGTYKADNRVIYFDINDFDECILGSCYLDVVRMLCCIYVAAPGLGITTTEADQLCSLFIEKYHAGLAKGYIRAFEKETAGGIIKDFLKEARKRKRKAFIKKHTHKVKGKTRLIIDDKHSAALPDEEKKRVIGAILKFAGQTSDPGFYDIRDVCFRIAGTSSLGLKRYMALVKGGGSPGTSYLLDIKEARNSCLEKTVHTKQPAWPDQASRIVEVQNRILPAPPALLATLEIDRKLFVIRELQPIEDRINHKNITGKPDNLKEVLEDMAFMYASGNLRSSGRQGSAIADELIRFARQKQDKGKELMKYALSYSQKLEKYYQLYAEAYDKGFFN